jgi:hypothetical protein
MNIVRSGVLATVLFLSANFVVAENPPAPQPVSDPALLVYSKPQRLIKLNDGRKIHLFCLGDGSPTVIMTAGLGDWAASWSKVQASIALKTRVCAWDRAGYGYSDPSAAPQDIGHTTADLEGVRIKMTAPPFLTMVCHCTGCQRMTGSAYSLSAAFPSNEFSVTKGEPVIGGNPRHVGSHAGYIQPAPAGPHRYSDQRFR